MRPVSGRKPCVGSSVVMRHCSAAPRSRMCSCVEAELGEGLARGDAHLRLHEVDVGDLFGDGVLDLDARVHLDEDDARRLRSPAVSSEELDGAGVLVADRLGEGDGVAVERRRAVRRSRFGAGAISMTFWWRRCTEQSRSNRCTVVPGRVGEDLHLDVARAHDGLLEEHARVAEGARRPRASPRRARAASSSRASRRGACRVRRRRRRPSRRSGSRCRRPARRARRRRRMPRSSAAREHPRRSRGASR